MVTNPRFIPWPGQAPQQPPIGQTGPPRPYQPMVVGGAAGTPTTPPAQGAGATPRFAPYQPQIMGRPTGGQVSMGGYGQSSPVPKMIGNLIGAGKGLAGGANTLNQAFGGNLFGGLGPYLGGVSNALGAAAAPLGIYNAVQTGNVPAGLAAGFGGAQSVASMLGSAGLGLLAAPISAGLAIAAYNKQAKEANKIKAALADTAKIRKDFGVAWPQMMGANTAYENLAKVAELPPEQQIPMLEDILQRAKLSLGAGPAVSQFLSTQGGRHGTMPGGVKVAPLDVSEYEKVSGGLATKAQLARYAAEDALRARGLDPGPWYGISTAADVQGLAKHGLAGLYNIDDASAAYNLTPEQLGGIQQGPNRIQNIVDLLTQLYPNYNASMLAPLVSGIPNLFQGASAPGWVDPGLARTANTQAHAEATRQQREQEALAQLMAQMAQQTSGVGSG